MKYKTEKELLEIVHKFKNGTISREDWGHAEHLIVGFYYVSNNDFETALDKMRDGIFNLLKAFEVDLNKEMPYHETMTVFWLKTIADFFENNTENDFVKTISILIEKYDKDYPLKFYDRDVLFSDLARKEFVPQNLL